MAARMVSDPGSCRSRIAGGATQLPSLILTAEKTGGVTLIRRGPGDLHVTCSFGVAEWHRGDDLNEGIKRAEEAMYRAKKQGRDRVEIELAAGESAPESQPA